MKQLIVSAALILGLANLQFARSEEQPADSKTKTVIKQLTKTQNKSPETTEAINQLKANATAEIQSAVKLYVEAYNARDAKSLAALWAPDAVYLSQVTGDIIRGRSALETEFAGQFQNLDQAKIEVATDSIEFISPSVALESGIATVIVPDTKPEKRNYNAIYIRREGKWLLDRVTENPEADVDTSHHDKLKALDWMVGSWVDRDENYTIKTDCKWIGNNNYLLRAFKVTSIEENDNVSGMQFIGWDANKKQIRSWVFDSKGGYAEGVWSQKKDRWIVKTKATLAGGEIATSTSILKPVDDDTFTWQKVNRVVEGEILPNIDEVFIIRE